MRIAKQTGWHESYIRWDLPLARAWPYYHCAALADGGNVLWAGEARRAREAFDAKLERLTARYK